MEPPPAPRWTEPEVAWPLALLAGFAGTWAGLSTGIPGTAAVLATLGFAALHAGLLTRGLGHRAALSTLGWLGGIAVAVAGVSMEQGLPSTITGLPFARVWAALRYDPWLVEGGPRGVDAWPLAGAALALALPALLTLTARLGAGILALLGLALATGAMAGSSGPLAVALVERGWHPLQAVGLSWPPHTLAVLAASALWISAAAARRPWDASSADRRSLVLWGAGLALFGVLGELLGHGPWMSWVVRLAGG